jgi:guanine deaminase
MPDGNFMRMAMDKAREGIEQGELPFGTCIVKDGEVVSCEHNRILSDGNVTAHAEINAIKEACHKLGTIDLSGCIAYCTCEPCPMCLGAFGLANVSEVVYGARISDVDMTGYTVLDTPPEMYKDLGDKMKVRGDFLKEENIGLFREWERLRCNK